MTKKLIAQSWWVRKEKEFERLKHLLIGVKVRFPRNEKGARANDIGITTAAYLKRPVNLKFGPHDGTPIFIGHDEDHETITVLRPKILCRVIFEESHSLMVELQDLVPDQGSLPTTVTKLMSPQRVLGG